MRGLIRAHMPDNRDGCTLQQVTAFLLQLPGLPGHGVRCLWVVRCLGVYHLYHLYRQFWKGTLGARPL